MALIEKAQFDELLAALGADQLGMLTDLLEPSYQEERGHLVAAMAAGDTSAFRRSAHSIKGMALNLAAGDLGENARALELYDGPVDTGLAPQIAVMDDVLANTLAAMKAALGK